MMPCHKYVTSIPHIVTLAEHHKRYYTEMYLIQVQVCKSAQETRASVNLDDMLYLQAQKKKTESMSLGGKKK